MACPDSSMSVTASTSPPPTEPLAPQGEGLASTLAIRRDPPAHSTDPRTSMRGPGAVAPAPAPPSLGLTRPTPLAAPKRHPPAAGPTPAARPGVHQPPGTKAQAERRAAGRAAPAFSEKVPAAEGLEAVAPGEHQRLPHTSRLVPTAVQYDISEGCVELEKTEDLQEAIARHAAAGAGAAAAAGAGASSLRRTPRFFLNSSNTPSPAATPTGMASGTLFQACAELRRRAHNPALRVSAAAHFVSLCLTVSGYLDVCVYIMRMLSISSAVPFPFSAGHAREGCLLGRPARLGGAVRLHRGRGDGGGGVGGRQGGGHPGAAGRAVKGIDGFLMFSCVHQLQCVMYVSVEVCMHCRQSQGGCAQCVTKMKVSGRRSERRKFRGSREQ